MAVGVAALAGGVALASLQNMAIVRNMNRKGQYADAETLTWYGSFGTCQFSMIIGAAGYWLL